MITGQPNGDVLVYSQILTIYETLHITPKIIISGKKIATIITNVKKSARRFLGGDPQPRA